MINDRCSTVDNTAISHILTAMVNMLNAFDKMHPDILVDKLRQMNVSDCISQLINNFMTGRSCCVKLGDCKSGGKPLTMEVPFGEKMRGP